jgi:uncharacterized protein YbjT (DUF2867 family)
MAHALDLPAVLIFGATGGIGSELARRLQLQEALRPRGVAVMLEAAHYGMIK